MPFTRRKQERGSQSVRRRRKEEERGGVGNSLLAGNHNNKRRLGKYGRQQRAKAGWHVPLSLLIRPESSEKARENKRKEKIALLPFGRQSKNPRGTTTTTMNDKRTSQRTNERRRTRTERGRTKRTNGEE